MTVLLVLLFICVFLTVDYFHQRKRTTAFEVNRARAPDIYYHMGELNPTMCDGGQPIKKPAVWLKICKELKHR